MPTMQYKMPVILLDKNTPKEAVCQVFENVNTGGVSLTVFELITAIFAMDDFELRKDWETRKEKYFSGDLLNVISATDFLTACTLLSTYKKGGTVSCKKKDVLNLTLDEYKKYADDLSDGFVEAEKILEEERIFSSKDLPYTTQFIPLAVLCTILAENNQIKVTNICLLYTSEKYKLQPNSMQVGFITNLKRILAAGEDRALLISATGTGKTYASAFAMRELGFKRVLFLVHRGQLARQTKKSYEKVFAKSVSMGLVGAGYHEYNADYVFATVQTLNRDEHLLQYAEDTFDCIILDLSLIHI